MTALISTNPENLEKWLTTLETTTDRQARGWLCEVDEANNTRSYCCLGLGSELAGLVGMPRDDPDRYEEGTYHLLYGDGGVDDLAPWEFIEWLGFVLPEYSDERCDLQLDIPRGRHEEKILVSTLNDTGCTFEQIAQMIRYFGIAKVTG